MGINRKFLVLVEIQGFHFFSILVMVGLGGELFYGGLQKPLDSRIRAEDPSQLPSLPSTLAWIVPLTCHGRLMDLVCGVD